MKKVRKGRNDSQGGPTDRRRGLSVFLLTVFLAVLCLGGSPDAKEAGSGERTPLQMEFYQYNTCASCHPEDEFYEIIGEELKEFREERPYEIFLYNPFRLADKERMEKRLKELGVPDVSYQTPVLMMGDRCLAGLEEIRANVRSMYREWSEKELGLEPEGTKEPAGPETADAAGETEGQESESAAEELPEQGAKGASWRERLEEIKNETAPEDSTVIYFSTISCEDCRRVKAVLDGLPDTAVMPDGSVSTVKIYEFNIMESDYVELLQKLFAERKVPDSEQQAPIVFYRDGFLSGAEAVEERLEEELAKGNLRGFDGFAKLSGEPDREEDAKRLSPAAYVSLAVTGFVNGLNPCGASMLLMLLAAAVVAGGTVRRLGLSYLAGKYAAYFAMGFGLYHLFLSVNQELLLLVSRGLTRIFAAAFLVLAVMYLLDFVHAKRQEYGKVRMQLPERLRKWNHEMIRRISGVPGKWLIPAAALLGVVISAGEFFCTGQVYLAAILYLMKLREGGGLQTVLAFLIYVTAMCVPSLLLVLAVEKTKNVIRASNTALKWMPAIKLVTALVFAGAAVFLLLS